MTDRALMIQGTASGVGKSLLVAGLCRLLVNRYRGEPALLEEAFVWLAERTGLPVLGAVSRTCPTCCCPRRAPPTPVQRSLRRPPDPRTYIHGLLDRADFRRALLRHWLVWDSDYAEDQTTRWHRDLDRLADTLRDHLRPDVS